MTEDLRTQDESGEYEVILSRRYSQWERVNFVDAQSPDDARSCFKDLLSDCRIVSVRRTGKRY